MATEVTRPNGGEESFAVPPSKTTPAQAGPEIRANAPGELRVIRRNGKVTGFDANKIAVAMTKAFLAVEGGNAAASGRVHNLVQELTEQLMSHLQALRPLQPEEKQGAWLRTLGAEAFDAARWAIDEVKATAPIWKREIEGGDARWVEGTSPA